VCSSNEMVTLTSSPSRPRPGARARQRPAPGCPRRDAGFSRPHRGHGRLGEAGRARRATSAGSQVAVVLAGAAAPPAPLALTDGPLLVVSGGRPDRDAAASGQQDGEHQEGDRVHAPGSAGAASRIGSLTFAPPRARPWNRAWAGFSCWHRGRNIPEPPARTTWWRAGAWWPEPSPGPGSGSTTAWGFQRRTCELISVRELGCAAERLCHLRWYPVRTTTA
jgi:hypothetical protein